MYLRRWKRGRRQLLVSPGRKEDDDWNSFFPQDFPSPALLSTDDNPTLAALSLTFSCLSSWELSAALLPTTLLGTEHFQQTPRANQRRRWQATMVARRWRPVLSDRRPAVD
ncbi:unnamed protein product [Linum trigynum]|uniref:Uncharacterized protein n=1 Tax=Linum trigynum TaxID=586398 RepID=A0AAV2G2B9_9ROSI